MPSRAFQTSRHPWIVLLLCISTSAAINVPAAFLFVSPENASLTAGASHQVLTGADAARAGWPDSTPVPWPAPDNYHIFIQRGIRHFNVYGPGRTTGKNSFQMTTTLHGWPLPSLRRTERWWDWDDATLNPTGIPSNWLSATGMGLYWPGVLLNPLILGIPLWLALVVPGLVRRRFRKLYDRCEECGYPAGTSPVCSECGDAVIPQRPPTTPASAVTQ